MTSIHIYTFLSYILFNLQSYVNCIENPENFVNILAGSFTDGRSFSTGNTLPLIGKPWGFNHWAPQTTHQNSRSSSWWFDSNQHLFTWLRCTHQPSPWIGDWGWFLFGPQIGAYTSSPSFYWEPRGATLKPYLFDATLAPHGLRVELVPTDHAAILRVYFPQNTVHEQKRICFMQARWDQTSDPHVITGKANQVNTDRLKVPGFGLHIYAYSQLAEHSENRDNLVCFVYSNQATVVEVRIATSLISIKQAHTNLNREVSDKVTFETIAAEAKDTWNKLLRRIDIVNPGDFTGETNRNLVVFYTGLYRALTFPRKLEEVDENGKVVHYSTYDQQGHVHDGPLCTDNGFWDTFRTVYPLLSVAYPAELGQLIAGWLNAYKEGGWLPSWASPGYRNCMVGTFGDVVIADAIVKQIPGFDYELARAALKKDSFEEPPSYVGSAYGKEGLKTYSTMGYFPYERGGEGVSKALDFAFSDWAVAKAFRALAINPSYISKYGNKKEELEGDAKKLEERSIRTIKRMFSKEHGLMVPVSADGNIVRSFDATEWGNGFTEGNAWHHSFPPFALDTLVSLHGSKQKLLEKLHQLLNHKSDFRVGSYGNEIHEMTEMRALAMGQYGHNNQPCHHILYLFSMLGEKSTTEEMVNQVIKRAYGEDFYAGDEDNGEQGAWFVLSAIGLYSIAPGSPDYVLNTPLFRHIRVYRSQEAFEKDRNRQGDEAVDAFDIVAKGVSPDNFHSNYVMLNGKVISGPSVNIVDVYSGSVIQYHMEGDSDSELPISREELYKKKESPKDLLLRIEEQSKKIEKLQEDLQSAKAIVAEHPIEHQVLDNAQHVIHDEVKAIAAPPRQQEGDAIKCDRSFDVATNFLPLFALCILSGLGIYTILQCASNNRYLLMLTSGKEKGAYTV